jgi:hypothetical protein
LAADLEGAFLLLALFVDGDVIEQRHGLAD